VTSVALAALLAEQAVPKGSLFADLHLGEAMEVTVPARLMPYFVGQSNQAIAADAELMFLHWLRRQLGVPLPSLKDLLDLDPPCSDPTVVDAFVPDWPVPGDFVDGADDPEYVKAVRKADLDSAIARQVCLERCAVRELCLARALRLDHADLGRKARNSDDLPTEEEIDSWMVVGGTRPKGRRFISAAARRLIRAYRTGAESERRRVRVANWEGMSRASLREWRERALAN
jgi:hypothetical protein